MQYYSRFIHRSFLLCLTAVSLLLLKGGVAHAQQDTLRHLPASAPLTAYTYPIADTWKYYTGHNAYFREEYAEKYQLHGQAMVIGVISHHEGVANPDHSHMSEFNVYAVAENHLPGTQLGGRSVPYTQLDLSGKAMVTMFDTPVTVSDSFFVSFNLTDYAHGGFSGNNIALLTGTDGSRNAADLAVYGRNAVRLHNHDIKQWRDFYTQNFTAVAVHFALYPIVEYKVTGVEDYLSQAGTSLYNIYPNPAISKSHLYIRYALRNSATVSFSILSIQGKEVLHSEQIHQIPGEHSYAMVLPDLAAGAYILVMNTSQTTLTQQFIVH